MAPSTVNNLCVVKEVINFLLPFSGCQQHSMWLITLQLEVSSLSFCDAMFFWPSPDSFLVGGGRVRVGSSRSSEPPRVGILQHPELGSFFSLRSEFQLIFPTFSIASPLTCPHRHQSQLIAYHYGLIYSFLRFSISGMVSATNKSSYFHLQNVPSFTTATQIQTTVISRLGSVLLLLLSSLLKKLNSLLFYFLLFLLFYFFKFFT